MDHLLLFLRYSWNFKNLPLSEQRSDNGLSAEFSEKKSDYSKIWQCYWKEYHKNTFRNIYRNLQPAHDNLAYESHRSGSIYFLIKFTTDN